MKGLKIYLVLSTLALAGYLVAQYYKPKPTDWTASYLKEDKIPFGLYILHQEIHDLFPDAEVKASKQRVYNTLKDKNLSNTSYLFAAAKLDMDKLDVKELLNYVNKGNQVFIAAFDPGNVLADTLKLETSSAFNYISKKSSPINFTNPALKAKSDYLFNKGLGDQYFSKFDTARVTVLGKNAKGDVNFVKYTFGKGAIYLLPNPQLLTNYSLLNPSGADYAARALSYLPSARLLIWDEYNTIKGNGDDSSVLRVIFRHAQLRWAYYLALIGLVAFVLFEMKRRQRIIPIIEPLRNSSVEFVKVVGRVYYQQRDNLDIANKKASYFLEHIRNTYQLKTAALDKDLEARLVQRSGADPEIVKELFINIRLIHHIQSVDDDLLISFNKLIEQFYKQAQ